MVKDDHFSFQTQLPKLKSNSLQKKNDLYLCSFFIIFFNISFLAFWFSFRLNQIFQVHDMTINFFVLFFHDLSTPGNDICHRCPSKLKHLFSCEDCFERLAFWSKVVYIILSKERIMAQKCSWEIGNFSISLPRGINQGQFWNVVVLWFVFGRWKGFLADLEL